MEILFGLLIIAVGAFCQSSSYVPIRKIRSWSWETFWLVQGLFAWLIFPFSGAMLAVPSDAGLFGLYASWPREAVLTVVFGMLWGVGITIDNPNIAGALFVFGATLRVG